MPNPVCHVEASIELSAILSPAHCQSLTRLLSALHCQDLGKPLEVAIYDTPWILAVNCESACQCQRGSAERLAVKLTVLLGT